MIKGIPIPAALPVLVVTWQSDPQGAGAHTSAKLTLAGVILGGIEPLGVARSSRGVNTCPSGICPGTGASSKGCAKE